ncbi:unnamed protein product [Gemmata massiliana]|uniref:Uncharacterized protein n=1 Tax=Gemmata massiliana TaxID=1210884 RepID=A0A6P2CXR2_9BACT|nr:hypothetical protein [Gemmata massiliana]VTR91922.1 unnamed protein product [Gemmata massiliana]
MNPNELASDGFFFALHLIESFGVVYDRDALLVRLEEIARGETSVFNSPEEELATLEKQRGYPAGPEERADFLSGFANRTDMDLNARLTANRILEVIRRDMGAA